MKLFFPAIRASSDIARRCSRMVGPSNNRTIAMSRITMRSGLRRVRLAARSAVDVITIQIRAIFREGVKPGIPDPVRQDSRRFRRATGTPPLAVTKRQPIASRSRSASERMRDRRANTTGCST